MITMKMISSTSTTSTSGVTLISLFRLDPPATFMPIVRPPLARRSGALQPFALGGDQGRALEARLVDHLQGAADILVLEPPVGLDHHVLARRRVVDVGELSGELVLGHPVLADEQVPVGLEIGRAHV